jgi:hypothetical protein
MQIKDYLNEILDVLAANPFVESQNLAFEERFRNAAFITGIIIFTNSAKLHFKEFVVFESEGVNVLKYGYNFISKDNTLIFRYDNALDPQAIKLSTYPEHRHTPEELLPAKRPSLEEVLREITGLIESKM